MKKLILSMCGTKILHPRGKDLISTLILSCFLCFMVVGNASAQIRMVHGKVVDGKTDEPMIGASVVINGKSSGTITNESGSFSINATSDDVLKISFIGYAEQSITIGGQRNIVVRLNEDGYDIQDVVVVGYGTQKKVNLTGAVGTVSARELEGKPVLNVLEALQGTIPGLTITQSSSKPGNRPSLNVRGLNTLNDNNPLVLIDGVQGDIQSVNPSDIEQVSVLKDASSAAIYGSRASNGVILITTKQGTANKNEATYEFRYGVQKATELPEIVNSWEYAELRNEALMNSGRAPEFTSDQIANFRFGDGPNCNWLDAIYKDDAPMQTHNFSLTGGSKNTTYLASVNYQQQESLLHGDDFGMKNYGARLNITHNVSDRFKFVANTFFNRNEVRSTAYWEEWIIEHASRVPSIYDIKNGDKYNYPMGMQTNPLARLEEGGYRLTSQDDLNGTVRGELKVIDGLKLTAMAGARVTWNRVHENRIALSQAEAKDDQTNAITEAFSRSHIVTTNVLLNYDKTFGKHTISALAGFSYEGTYNNGFQTDRGYAEKDFPYNGNDVLGAIGVVGSEVMRITNAGTAGASSLYSALGRATYNYDEKYLFEFNIRDDISSKFAKGNRAGIFPSFSGGWRISQEDFYQPLAQYMPNLKLRASWGLVGNNRITDYAYLAQIAANQGYTFGGLPVNTASYAVANENMKWEVTRMTNVGIDISLLKKGNLNISFDYFDNKTTDILMNLTVPGTYGAGSPIQNAGVVQTQGWELVVNYNFRTASVNHYVTANLSDSRNKVLDLKGTENINGGGPCWILKEGYPIWAYYAYRSDGLFQNEEEVNNGPHTSQGAKPGDIRYVDKNGDGEIKSEDDRFILGTRDPRYSFGIYYGLTWKGLDFSMFWQGVGKRNAWMRGESVEAFHNGNSGPLYERHKDRWTPGNPNASYPRLTVGGESANNAVPSDFWISNAAYIRLKNMQLGYTIPERLTKKVLVKNLRIFASVQNAFTFSKMKGTGWDPEYSEGSGRLYPVSRIYSLGVDLKF